MPGRGGVLVADAGHDGGDVTVLPVERLAALHIVPGQRGQPAFDGRDGVRLLDARRLSRGAGGNVKADDLGIGRKHLDALASAPTRKMLPVGGIGAAGVSRARCFDIVAGVAGKRVEMRRQAWRGDGRERGRGVVGIAGGKPTIWL